MVSPENLIDFIISVMSRNEVKKDFSQEDKNVFRKIIIQIGNDLSERVSQN